MDMAAFAAKMKKRAEQLPEQVNEVKKQVAKKVLSTGVLRTPVDTSEALSNWQVGLGSPSAPRRPPHFPGRFGSTRLDSARATIAIGESKIDKVKPGQEIHISNGVDYIKALNDGTISSQPGGFVEAAVLVGRKEVKSAKLIPDDQ